MLINSGCFLIVIVLFGLIFTLVHGDTCTTPNGEVAQCISIYKCDTLYYAARNRNPEVVRFLRESQCGYFDEPFVCCGSVGAFQTMNTQSNSNLFPSRDSCGFQEEVRILGGTATQYNEFPWMALLEYRKNSGGTTFACGGVLISNRYILTAAHCVTGQINEKVGPLQSVRLGEWNTDSGVDCISVEGYDLCNDAPLDVPVQNSIAHADYNDGSINRYHDIALVRLTRKVSFTQFVKPICLPSASDSASVGSELWVSGWGRTENANFSPVKLKVKLPVVANDKCSDTFRKAGVNLANTQLCAGGEKNKDSCNGDSGGPLMHTTKEDNTQWYVEGIVSFGTRCGTENWPGIYTRVTEYLPWINQNVHA